ncbi:putative zinc protease Rv2782c [Paraliobacillus ryukyuensis]|uniref:Putative Zn-dependent peptidase n=1 Tax=Paraliobacillus ryukyuensis TaxID=200904 RepID=A0A366EH16_9BACI|nr:pitrilysin family protein [Paraliobacillus ryukyuensis]RBP01751.1 putative Zn-dependent peptidase [Paraliobacillus ryukyuensis]
MLQKHTSDNGLRLVIESIPTVRSVTIGIWVHAGSRDETEANNGISHFLEHMFFKGTKTHNAKEIAETFDAIGAQINAFTSKEYTCYYVKVLDTHKTEAMALLAEMFFHSTFDQEEMEKEKNVILEEIRMVEDTPDDIVHDLLAEASFGQHALSYPILGTEQTLRSFTRQDLFDYKDRHYTPNNVVISVAGNVEADFMKQLEQTFDQFGSTNNKKVLQTPAFEPIALTRQKQTEQAHFCLGYQGLAVDDPDIYSLITVNNILGGSMSSRLFQEIREQRGLAYSVFSYHSSFLDDGLLTIYAGTGKEYLETLQTTIQDTIATLMSDGLTQKELTNSKEQMKANLLLGLESTDSRMSRNGKNELILGRQRSLDELVTAIDNVTIESTAKIIKQVFDEPYSSALIRP